MRRGAVLLVGVFVANALAALERVPGPPEQQSEALRWSAWRVFDARDGLPQAAVYSLAQDADGVVYAGTEDGVAAFDGANWSAMQLPSASAPPTVGDLQVDAGGGLWAGTDTFGVLYRAPGAVAFERVALPRDAHEVGDLAPAGGNAVWVAHTNGLAHCMPTGCRAIETLDGRAVAELLPEQDGSDAWLWLGIEGEGLFRLDAPHGPRPRLSPRLLSRDQGLPNNAIRALLRWQGALWIGTGRGLARWQDDRLTVYDAASGFTDGIVYTLLASVDAQGQPRLRAAQRPGGMIEIAPDGSWVRHGTAVGLPEDNAFTLIETRVAPNRPAVLWIGMEHSGVARFEPGNWQAMDERSGLPHRALLGLGRVALATGAEHYWAGTAAGAVIWEDGRWRPWLPPALAEEGVIDLVTDGDTRWLATLSGLYRWQGDTLRRFHPGNSVLPGLNVLDLHREIRPDGSARLWVLTRHGVAWIEDEILVRDPEPERLLGDAWFRDVVETGAEGTRTRWLGGQGGLLFDRGAGWQPMPAPCLPHRDVMELTVHRASDGAESLWVGSRGGITRIDPARLGCQSLGRDTLGKSTVYQIQFDRRDRAYLFGYDGVKRLTFAPQAPYDLARASLERFDLADGLPSLEFRRGVSLVDERGRIWGGGSGGIAIYDPAAEQAPAEPAPLRLLEARILPDGRELIAGAALRGDDAGLRFRYRLLTARREHRIEYRTELVGLDSGPGPWTRSAEIEYSRLPPGNYRFRVWGRDEHGIESGPHEVGFAIPRPLWMQPWALGAYALLLLGAGVLLGRLRARALALRARWLEQQVATRTGELEQLNARLEQASLTDPLTGLGNRRRFYAEVPALLERSPRLALLLVDMDHFKRINDSRGHDAGDAVLREFSQRLAATAEAEELAVRWGGEEFLVALPDADAARAQARAEALLSAVRGSSFLTAQGALDASCSIGWVCLPWASGDVPGLGLDQALSLADLALYRAKRAGRDLAIGAMPGSPDDERIDPPGLHVRWIDATPVSDNLVPFRR